MQHHSPARYPSQHDTSFGASTSSFAYSPIRYDPAASGYERLMNNASIASSASTAAAAAAAQTNAALSSSSALLNNTNNTTGEDSSNSRMHLFLRLLELEKSFHRQSTHQSTVEDLTSKRISELQTLLTQTRQNEEVLKTKVNELSTALTSARLSEDSTKLRLAELASANTVLNERTVHLTQRLNELELSSRETEQLNQDRATIESETVQRVKSDMQTHLQQIRTELHTELQQNITLRNTTHHRELLSLIEQQQDQHLKFVRNNEITQTGIQTKVYATEARLSGRLEKLEQMQEQLAAQVRQEERRWKDLESRINTLQSELNDTLQESFSTHLQPIHTHLQQLQTHCDQSSVTYTQQFSTHYQTIQTHSSQLTSLGQQVEYTVEHFKEALEDVEGRVEKWKEQEERKEKNYVTKQDLTSLTQQLQTDLTTLRSHSTHFESDVTRKFHDIDQHMQSAVHPALNELRDSFEKLRDEQIVPMIQDIGGVKTIVEEQNTTQRRHEKAAAKRVANIEEQLAVLQAKLLVAQENSFVVNTSQQQQQQQFQPTPYKQQQQYNHHLNGTSSTMPGHSPTYVARSTPSSLFHPSPFLQQQPASHSTNHQSLSPLPAHQISSFQYRPATNGAANQATNGEAASPTPLPYQFATRMNGAGTSSSSPPPPASSSSQRYATADVEDEFITSFTGRK